MRRLVQGDFVEADLARALAAQILVGRARQPQPLDAQILQIDAPVGLQHIGLQHGVVPHPAQGDAFVGEHMRVVLGMVQQLGGIGVFQPGPQAIEHQRRGPVDRACPARDGPPAHRRRAPARWQRTAPPGGPPWGQGWWFRYPGPPGARARRPRQPDRPAPPRRGWFRTAAVSGAGGASCAARASWSGIRVGLAGFLAQPGAEPIGFIQFDQRLAVERAQAEPRRQPGGVELAVQADGQQFPRQGEVRRRRAQVLPRPRRGTSPARASSVSMSPYSPSHLAAVLGPTLSTPGTLSTASPVSIR